MKVLLINGSPNANGCTFTALTEVAGALERQGIETEIFQLGKGAVRGCIDCRACRKLGKCAFDDDCANTIAEKIIEADGLVLGSPVYYASANGALCAVLDRVFASSSGKFAGKPGASVVSCRRGGAGNAFDRLNKYFSISRMPVVSSSYWNSVHGFTPDDVRKDKEGLQTMRILGDNMAWLIKRLAGTQPEVVEPKTELTCFADGK